MALQRVYGVQSNWFPGWLNGWTSAPASTEITMDAAGEGAIFVGRCLLEGGSGSKVISSAGGKIHWLVGASANFAQAGTTLRLGIQDVSASGPPARGDGNWDVYDDMVGGTDTLTSTTEKTTTMSNGSKTINHGDLIAVVWDMSSRQNPDSVRVRYATPSAFLLRPTVTSVAAGPAYTIANGVPSVVIEFDDGTIGVIDGGWNTSTAAMLVTTTYNSGSTPDEYALIFTPKHPMAVDAVRAMMQLAASGDFEFVLYSDAEGTPAVIETITVSVAQTGGTGVTRELMETFTQARVLAAGTKYAIAVRPTSANNVVVYRYAVSAAAHWGGHWHDADCYVGSRSNQSGAFSPTLTERVFISLRQAQLDDGAGIIIPARRNILTRM